MRTAVLGGTVVSASGAYRGEVLVDGETIAAVAAPGSDLAATFAGSADLVIDASGKYVIPGGIDAHTHFGATGQNAPVLDTFETGTIAAAFGGTTTVLDFAYTTGDERPEAGYERHRGSADGFAAVDYGFHMMLTRVDGQTAKEMDMLVDIGVTSFKMFMAYPGKSYSDDGQILRMMQNAANNGALIQMHAENGIAIDVLREQAVARGQTDPLYHSLTRPPVLEAEAVHRAVALAEVAGAALYIVHLSSAEAMEQVAAARHRGLNVFAETCPQYLYLSLDDLAQPDFEGGKYVCSPPVRDRSHHDHLWRGLRTNELQTVATDHCPFCWDQKLLGRDDFRDIPNGIPAVEHRIELLYEGAVRGGRLSLSRWVDVCSTTPARLFGLWPRKGTISAGADADIVVFDPDRPHVISATTHHMNVDYSAFEGTELSGKVVQVLLRGKLIVDGERYLGRPGNGRFLERDVPANLL